MAFPWNPPSALEPGPSAALHKLSEAWSFCVGDGTRDGFPLVAASTGFERLTLCPRSVCLGKKCGEVLGAAGMNPEWLLEHIRTAVRAVASGDATWADFLVMNRRGDMSCFPNYVRLVMLNTLSAFPDPATERMVLALQVDASDLVQQFQVEASYAAALAGVRSQLLRHAGVLAGVPEELQRCETGLQLQQLVKQQLLGGPLPPLPVAAARQAERGDAKPSGSSASTRSGTPPASASSDGSDAGASGAEVFAVTYRHTATNFKEELLAVAGLQHCVLPHSVPRGPLVFAEDPKTHQALLQLAADWHPRHVLVEARLLPLVSAQAERIKGSRGRKVNEKQRQRLLV